MWISCAKEMCALNVKQQKSYVQNIDSNYGTICDCRIFILAYYLTSLLLLPNARDIILMRTTVWCVCFEYKHINELVQFVWDTKILLFLLSGISQHVMLQCWWGGLIEVCLSSADISNIANLVKDGNPWKCFFCLCY